VRACGTACAQWKVASGVRCRARVRTPETQVEAAPGVGETLSGDSPPPGQSQLKAVTPGQSQLKSGYTGAKVNSCLASAALPRERPTALQGMPAMHLRRAQPCTSAAHSRAAAALQPPHARLTQAAAVSHASRLVLASPHTTCPKASAYHTVLRRPLLHHTLADICSQPERRLQLLLLLLPHDARPYGQGCRHPRDKQPDEGDSHL